MSALPRGITQVYWKNKTKTKEKQVKFRVRVNKKVNGQQVKVDQLCDDLEQAKDLLATCRVPDDWLLKNKRPLLHGREVLQAVLATWQSRAKELPC